MLFAVEAKLKINDFYAQSFQANVNYIHTDERIGDINENTTYIYNQIFNCLSTLY